MINLPRLCAHCNFLYFAPATATYPRCYLCGAAVPRRGRGRQPGVPLSEVRYFTKAGKPITAPSTIARYERAEAMRAERARLAALRALGTPTRAHKHMTDLERLYLYTPERPADGCWIWQGSRHPNGYGRVRASGREQWAHRVSYAAHVGPIPAGMHLLHSCDTPACINPAHLRPGTHQENMRERTERGHRRPPVYLSDEQRAEAYAMLEGGTAAYTVAAHFGVSMMVIHHIRRTKGAPVRPGGRRRWTEDTERAALALLVDGLSQHAVAERIGVPRSAIQSLCRRYGLEQKRTAWTDDQIAEILAQLDAGVSHQTVARRYGVSPTTIFVLKRKHRPIGPAARILPAELVRQIERAIRAGEGDRAIARRLGVHPKTVYKRRHKLVGTDVRQLMLFPPDERDEAAAYCHVPAPGNAIFTEKYFNDR